MIHYNIVVAFTIKSKEISHKVPLFHRLNTFV